MAFPWLFHGFSIAFPLLLHSFSMAFHGLSKAFPRYFQGLSMALFFLYNTDPTTQEALLHRLLSFEKKTPRVESELGFRHV